MFDGNISSFLGMSRNDDGTGDFDNSSRSNYQQRKNNVRNHYIKSGYKAKMGIDLDPETGEILDYVPPKNVKNPYKNMANYPRQSGINLRSLSYKLPQPKQAINIALLGFIAYGGYIVYKKFLSPLGNSPIEDAKLNAEKIVAKSYVDTPASKIQQTNATATTLANQGLQVADLHKNLANTLHSYLNSANVDHEKIVKTISSMAIQTLQLVSVAYGSRNLNTYAKAPLHVFNSASWSDLFSDNKMVGTLKDHLNAVLASSELSKLSKYLQSIS